MSLLRRGLGLRLEEGSVIVLVVADRYALCQCEKAILQHGNVPQARRVRTGNVDDEHVGVWCERTDSRDEVVRRFWWAFFILS